MDFTKFVRELNSSNSLSALEGFANELEECDDPKQLIQGLMKVSPNLDHILHLLNNETKENNLITSIFDVVGSILLCVTGDDTHENISLHITRWVLQNHSRHLLKHLSSKSTAKENASALHFLTGIVVNSSAGAYEILTRLNLSEISFTHLAGKGNPSKEAVRLKLFYFILAFLNCPDNGCLNQFLQIQDSVACLFEGLPRDRSELVIKLLNSLYESVVLNINVSKTLKVRVFQSEVCELLMYLYFNEPHKSIPEDSFTDAEKKEIISSLHKLIITLCSDFKHGIIYKGTKVEYGKTGWPHAFRILKTLNSPWKFEQGRELITVYLTACPDSSRFFKDTFMSLLFKPCSNPSFVGLIELFIQLTEKRDPLKYINANCDYIDTLKQFSVSIDYVSKRLMFSLLNNGALVLKHCGIRLMLAMFTKAKEYIDRLCHLDFLNEKTKIAFKKTIIKELHKYIEFVNRCVALWIMSFVDNKKEELPDWYTKDPTKFAYLSNVVDLFSLYSDIFGYAFIRNKIIPLNMLKKVLNLPQDEIQMDIIHYQKLLISVLKFNKIAQENGSFEAFGFSKLVDKDKENINLQEDFFHRLIKIYINSKSQNTDMDPLLSEDLSCLSLSLLNATLDRWGLSLYADHHLIVWLNNIKREKLKEQSGFVAKVITKSVDNMFSYLDVAITTNDDFQSESYKSFNLAEEVNSIPDDIEIEDNADVKIKDIKIPFSCLMLSAVDNLNSKIDLELVSYFSGVAHDYIHCVSDPRPLATYLLNNKQVLNEETCQYLQTWTTKGKMSDWVSLKEDVDLLSKIKAMFLSESAKGASDFIEEVKGNVTNSNEMTPLFRQILLYIQNEMEDGQNHKRKKLKFFVKIFRNLIKIPEFLSNFESFEKSFEYLLTHYFVISSYDPFSRFGFSFSSDLNDMVSVVTQHYPKLHYLLRPFLEKCIGELSSVFKDAEFDHSIPILFSCSLLTYQDIERIVLPVLKNFDFPCSVSFAHLFKVSSLIFTKSFANCIQTSSEITKLLLEKILHSSTKSLEEHEIELGKSLFKTLAVSLQVEMIRKLNQDELNFFVSSPFFDPELCSKIISLRPGSAKVLTIKLNLVEPDFKNQAPLIHSLLRVGKNKDNIDCYLMNIKDGFSEWIAASDSQENEAYKDILEYMLQCGVFTNSEIESLRKNLYESVVLSKKDLPPHILSLVPLFLHRDILQEENSEGDSQINCYSDIQLLCICICGVLRQYGKKNEDVVHVSKLADVILSIVNSAETKFIRRQLYSSNLWFQFVKQVLKQGFTDVQNGPILLKCVSVLSKIVYSKRKREESCLPPHTLLQMLRSHSQFIPIMLNSEREQEAIKEQLVLLQLAIVECHPEVCEERHVPILLGSYEASRSLTDQALLKIMYLYEKHECMTSIQPTLWGRAAVAHYAVEQGPGMSKGFRVPWYHQILTLLDVDKVIETAKNFDMNMELEPTEFYKSNPALYDQRYLLTLFVHITDDVSPRTDVIDLVGKGMVAMGLAALSSHSDIVWSVGATLLKNIVQLFERSWHHNLRLQWIWLVGVLGYGLEEKKQRVPSLIIHFLIDASQMLLYPQDVMYSPVMNYLYLKPGLALFKVPELYNLFFSDSVEYNRNHRTYLLELLSYGIRDDLDYEVCQRSFFPKLLLSLVNSPTINSQLRVLSLNVLKSMVQTWAGAQELVKNLMVQLPLALEPQLNCHSKYLGFWIDAVVDVLEAFWNTSQNQKLKFTSTSHDKISSYNHRNKRKAQEITDDCIDKQHPSKKKKLSIGTGDKGLNTLPMDANSNKRKKYVGKRKWGKFKGFTDFVLCLGKVMPIVVANGSEKNITVCLNLLSEVVDCCEKFSTTDRKVRLNDVRYLRQQIKPWIDISVLERRFSYLFDSAELLYLCQGSSTGRSWKDRPLKAEINVQNTDDNNHQENLLRSMKQLFLKLGFRNLT